MKSPEWRWQRRRADLRHFEIFRHGPIIIILDYQLGEPTIRSVRSPQAVSVWSAFLIPFLPFVYGCPSSSPRAHCTPNKSVPTLRYTRRHGPILHTGPCPKALTECSPLDFRRSSISVFNRSYEHVWHLVVCVCVWKREKETDRICTFKMEKLCGCCYTNINTSCIINTHLWCH